MQLDKIFEMLKGSPPAYASLVLNFALIAMLSAGVDLAKITGRADQEIYSLKNEIHSLKNWEINKVREDIDSVKNRQVEHKKQFDIEIEKQDEMEKRIVRMEDRFADFLSNYSVLSQRVALTNDKIDQTSIQIAVLSERIAALTEQLKNRPPALFRVPNNEQ